MARDSPSLNVTLCLTSTAEVGGLMSTATTMTKMVTLTQLPKTTMTTQTTLSLTTLTTTMTPTKESSVVLATMMRNLSMQARATIRQRKLSC